MWITPATALNVDQPASNPGFGPLADGEHNLLVAALFRSTSDRNGNLTPDACECPADFDADGTVGPADLATLLGAWGSPDADIDGNGDTDATDLAFLLGAFGACGGGEGGDA